MIAAIAGDMGREAVERIIRSAAPEGMARAERRLYYPYYWLELRYAAKTWLGRSTLRLGCLVDARTRAGATADPFAVERVAAPANDVVAARVDEPEAARIAARYTGYVLRNRRRALVSPAVDVISSRLVYKPFWIVTHEAGFRLLVDAVTGGYYPLSRTSAPR